MMPDATPATTTASTPVTPGGAPAAALASTSASLSTPTSTSGAPPASPAAGGAPATSTETVNPGAWMAGFDDDTKGWVQNKGYKGPADLANAYRSLEKLHGVPQDRLLKLPENFYDDKGAMTAEGRAIYERLGAPKDAKEYGIEVPKEHGDPARLEKFIATAKDLGLTKVQAQKLAAMDAEYIGGQRTAAAAAATNKFNDEVTALKTEWGAAYDSNRTIAGDAMRRLGLTSQQVDAMSGQLGHKETMKLLNNIGKSVGEGAYIPGTAANRPLEPAGAKAKIKELMLDRDFGSRLEKGDADAKAQWERLHQQAYQGTVNV